MELIFMRHGQGVHNTAVPDRLNVENPRLTEKGIAQVTRLRDVFAFEKTDLFIVSPTVRTIETANVLTSSLSNPKKYVSPLIGPRMFPFPENPKACEVKCDKIYHGDLIEKEYPDYTLLEDTEELLWQEGINTISPAAFNRCGLQLKSWLKQQSASRTFLITHDGTITNYRIFFGETGLSRADFLGEAGWCRVNM